jgi:hypothetical protein
MKRYRTTRAASCVFLLFAALAAPVPSVSASAGAESFAASSPTVSFASPVQYAEPGALCTLRVMVDGAIDSLSCMGVYIALDDTAVADVKIAYEGQLFKASGNPTFFHWERTASDSAGAESCVLGYRTYFIAPGELARFVFQTKASGTCRISFVAIRLWDIDRLELSPLAGAPADIVVGSTTGSGAAPLRTGALHNYPNPFNPSTVLTLWLPQADGRLAESGVRLDVFSVSGERVRALFDGPLASGAHEIVWDGRDDRGSVVPTGVYFGVARTEREVFKRKMIVIR